MRSVLSLLSEQMTAWLKERMMNPDKIPMSPAALEFKAAMHAAGIAEGLAEGKRQALMDILRSRAALAVTSEERGCDRSCMDPERLGRWIVKALTAESVGEVLEAEKKAPAKRSPARAPKAPARTAKRRVKSRMAREGIR